MNGERTVGWPEFTEKPCRPSRSGLPVTPRTTGKALTSGNALRPGTYLPKVKHWPLVKSLTEGSLATSRGLGRPDHAGRHGLA